MVGLAMSESDPKVWDLESTFEDLERKNAWLEKRLSECSTASERNHYISMSQVKYELGVFKANYDPFEPGTLEPRDDPVEPPSLWAIRADAQESKLNSAATLDLLTNPDDPDKHGTRLESIEGQIRDLKLYLVGLLLVICFLFYWHN